MRISDWSSDVCSSDLIQRSSSDRRKRQVPPTLKAGISPLWAKRYTVRLPALRNAATSSSVRISPSESAISPCLYWSWMACQVWPFLHIHEAASVSLLAREAGAFIEVGE